MYCNHIADLTMYQVPCNCCSVSSETANMSFISQSAFTSGSDRSDLSNSLRLRPGLTFQCDAARLVDVAGRHLVEHGVLVVDCAVEGAGLIVSTGHQTGQSLETISVSQTGHRLRAALGHHTDQVGAGCPLRRTEVKISSLKSQVSSLKSVRNNKHLVKFLRLFY